VRVRAFAKINLSLRVLRRRRDGYHDLRTVFQSIALHDTLTIAPHRGAIRLTCDDAHVPVDASNLVLRAAEAIWEAAGRRGGPRGVAIHLTKRIPVAAGLGGGSADAAAALRALGALWRVDDGRLRSIGAALGADVAYFLVGGTAMGLGRGDVLLPLADRSDAWVVVAVPEFGVSTPHAYAWWDEENDTAKKNPDINVNDLEGPVARRHPEIARLIAALRTSGASLAAMSGSGSAVFGLFDERTVAVRAARRLGGRTLVTRTLSRALYQRLAGAGAHRLH